MEKKNDKQGPAAASKKNQRQTRKEGQERTSTTVNLEISSFQSKRAAKETLLPIKKKRKVIDLERCKSRREKDPCRQSKSGSGALEESFGELLDAGAAQRHELLKRQKKCWADRSKLQPFVARPVIGSPVQFGDLLNCNDVFTRSLPSMLT